MSEEAKAESTPAAAAEEVAAAPAADATAEPAASADEKNVEEEAKPAAADGADAAPAKSAEDEEKKAAEVRAAVEEEAKKEVEAEEAAKKEAKRKNAEELTKRLQKLALEHQKETMHDRLKVIQADQSSHLSSAKTFQELNLPKHLLDAIFEMGFERPSAIQEEALPRILADPPRNVIGQAQSGSGKTAAFVLGMLYRIVIDAPATVQALCVTPTRELAVQIVQKAVAPMAAHMTGLNVQLALAGEMVERGKRVDAHLIVGTPGKIVDWMKRKTFNTKNIKVFVLDEADNMVAESGHRANSLLIKKQMPKTCQSLFFSATFPDEVVQFATKMVHNPDKILIERGPEALVSTSLHRQAAIGCILFYFEQISHVLSYFFLGMFVLQVLDIIKQIWVDCQQYDGGKLGFLSDIYSLLTIGQSIVFVGTKHDADAVHNTLTSEGYTCSLLHGGVDNAVRDQTMESFRKGESTVLITTNVLARGVDVDNVCLVVNYDVPVTKDGDPDFETYLHRIGRTGRFGRKGSAINLIGDQRSIEVLAAIEAHFATGGKEMISMAEADPEALAEQIEI